MSDGKENDQPNIENKPMMPEMGQFVHGNPTGPLGTERYQDALVLALLDEIDRVYWNQQQKEWHRFEDPLIPGLEFRSYYWGDKEEEAVKPNLKFDFSEQEVRWYKHPGRSMSVTIDWTPDEWVQWFHKAMDIIISADKHDW